METNHSTSKDSFRIWLQSELMQRCRKNSNYSLRAFSGLLDMDASSISQILSGKRRPSAEVITKICEKLSARPELKNEYINECSYKREKKTIQKKMGTETCIGPRKNESLGHLKVRGQISSESTARLICSSF